MKTTINRRNFLKLSALGGASLIATGCGSDPIETLVPLQVPPYDYVSGKSIHFATTCRECSAACGLIVRTREGRAIKAEGNPRHPISQGGICLQGQSVLQGLYSPARAAGPVSGAERRGITWQAGLQQLADQLKAAKDGAGEILYLGPPVSGTFPEMLETWLSGMGGGTAVQVDMSPVNSLRHANQLIFGKSEIPHYAPQKAELLINFGADFLESWLNPIQLTKGYTRMHGYKGGKKGRLVQIGPHLSLTGTNADQWVSCPMGFETAIALSLTGLLLPRASHLSEDEKQRLERFTADFSSGKIEALCKLETGSLNALAEEFGQEGRSLALAGGNSCAGANATQLQMAVNLLNYAAGNIGHTVVFGADYRLGGNPLSDLEAAIADMKAGRYAVVLIENVNPMFTLPAGSGFREALESVPLVVSLSTENDETAALAGLHLPTDHFLESWGDGRPRNGVYALQQPATARVPGFDTRDVGDLLLELARLAGLPGFTPPTWRDYIKAAWREVYAKVAPAVPFSQFWKQSLQHGGHYEAFQPAPAVLTADLGPGAFAMPRIPQKGLRLLAVNSNLHNANAKGGNRSWLLEIPHPVTQVVWDSWVELNPETALKLGIKHGDLVTVKTEYGSVQAAAWIWYGIAKGVLAMPAGMGRKVPFPQYATSHGRSKLLPVIETKSALKIVPQTAGINVMALLPWRLESLSGDFLFAGERTHLQPTGKKAYLVTMDGQDRRDIASPAGKDQTGIGDRSQKGRGFVQVMGIGEKSGTHHGHGAAHHGKKRYYTLKRKAKKSFYDPMAENVSKAVKRAGKQTGQQNVVYHDPYKWEMIIDLDRCTGCSACVAACFAENNIPLVGKDRAAVNREMSWLRIERFFEPNPETGQMETYFTPEMCQQCDNAGCEPVCPVYATYQTPDGLNAMIYNRCVGTRYCSNNCIYKLRRFNWRSYEFPAPLHMQLNPAVSVRSKGVMEKCTFCQHRIREMTDLARDQGRDVLDGEVKTACQQACPADAITFGNIKDEDSRIRRLKDKSRRGYTQLPELNYQPAITYLKKVNHNHRKA